LKRNEVANKLLNGENVTEKIIHRKAKTDFINKKELAMIKIFNYYGKVCINKFGGFNGLGFGCDEIIKIIDSESFIFP
jgi:hypothetical protein